jgi:acyl dehydratase
MTVSDVQHLDRPPALLPLYARAVLPRPGGDAVPGTVLQLPPTRPELAHVARYAELCGFRLTSALPPTYPHLLGFPLQMQLMADRRFPFPATGLVHIANEVQVHHPVPVDAELTVAVQARGPFPHRRGRTVVMDTSVRVDDEPAWTSSSTYLRRGKGTDQATGDGLDVPQDLPTTARWRLPADLGRTYAAVSGDRNPIHLWPLTAKAFGFPRAIAHGMWTAAAALAALEGRLPDRYRYAVEFKAPVLLPSTVELGTRLHDDGSAEQVLRSARSGRTQLLAEARPR